MRPLCGATLRRRMPSGGSIWSMRQVHRVAEATTRQEHILARRGPRLRLEGESARGNLPTQRIGLLRGVLAEEPSRKRDSVICNIRQRICRWRRHFWHHPFMRTGGEGGGKVLRGGRRQGCKWCRGGTHRTCGIPHARMRLERLGVRCELSQLTESQGGVEQTMLNRVVDSRQPARPEPSVGVLRAPRGVLAARG